jgi:hypothetical protein
MAQCFRLRGTTLVAPCGWAAAALLMLGVPELIASWSAAPPSWLPHARFLAAGATFCPFVALLGAKRPQDRAWQFVVLSLLALVVFFGLTELAFWPGRPPSLHWIVRWLLVAPLLAMGAANYLLTRYWLPGLVAALGKFILLLPQFPELHGGLPAALAGGTNSYDRIAAAGLVCLSSAVALAWALGRRGASRRSEVVRSEAARHPSSRAADPRVLDRGWLDFRDQFGTFWALRVAGRINQSAEQLGLGVRLSWQGLTREGAGLDAPAKAADLDGPTAASLRRVIQSLLRRFVNDEWLARRWGEDTQLCQIRIPGPIGPSPNVKHRTSNVQPRTQMP